MYIRAYPFANPYTHHMRPHVYALCHIYMGCMCVCVCACVCVCGGKGLL